MGLFQKPASTPDELARSRPLALTPAQVAGLDEDAWVRQVYRGDDAPQLTVRAVVMGALLGTVLAFANVYVGLKSSWSMNVALTACIISFTLGSVLVRAGLARTGLSILESNCMQSTASAAGYSTGTMVNCAVPGLLLLTVAPGLPGGHQLPWPLLFTWILLTALLGVVVAVPCKRTLIDRERLTFPSGVAAAETLHSLHSRGAAALRQGRALIGAALASAVTPVLFDLRLRAGGALLPGWSRAFDWIPARGPRRVLSDWTVVLDHKLVMVALGVIVGPRVGTSFLLAALLLAYVIGPAGLAAGAVTDPGQAWLELGLWVGAPLLLCSGLTALVFTRRRRSGRAGGHARAFEVPSWVFGGGVVVAGGALMVLAHGWFQIPWLLGALAVGLTVAMSFASARATGDSDITPVGPMAVLTQLVYGALAPQSAAVNIVAAAVTTGGAASSADLLTDWKAGHLLGAHPGRQFVAQLLGIVPGAAATTLCYYLLVPDATALSGPAPAFAAPAAHMWLATARVVTRGLGSLHPMAQLALVCGALAGVALTLLERLPVRRFLPSAAGLGLGFVLPAQVPVSIFIGGAIAWIWSQRRRGHAERYAVPVASGVIAGESLAGVVVAALNSFVLRG